LGRFLHAQGIRPERLQVIPLGIDMSAFQEIPDGERAMLRQRFGIGDRPLVMYTGSLDRFQRLDYLLQAMRLVVHTIADAQLLLVANVATTQDLRACQAMIRELTLEEHVTILTNTSFEEIPRFLAAADVTVVPRPHCPGFPVKLLNYMAAGKPIVVFAGSAKGLQHLQQAFVAADHDWQELGQGLITLLQDPTLAKTLGQNAQQWAHTHVSWPNVAGNIEHIYYELIEPSYCTRQPSATAVSIEAR
jgi:glycosyltransferase involved in cell wall biosynthesis